VLLLKSHHHTYRAVFTKDDASIPVPIGHYRIPHYKIERQHEGEPWMLFTTGKEGLEVEIRENEETSMELDEQVYAGARVPKPGKVNMAACSPDGRGFTVVRKDKRVEVTYEILNGAGKVVNSGKLQYG
jgi:hypothetical protein